jgi:acetyltransferase-like isoleucine patch superfamily enzyme
MLKKAFARVQARAMVQASVARFSAPLTMAHEESKHRAKLPLYDLDPKIENAWVAPNATIVGQVRLRRWASVWYNSVVRGDINRVE